MVLCKQVQEGILAPENQRYIRRNLELICENLLDVLHSGPGQEAKQQVAKCLGRIGYVVEQDFKRYATIASCVCEKNILCLLLHLQYNDVKLQNLHIISRYMDWTFNKYSLERKDDIKCLLIKSISETLKMDAETSKLKDFSVVNLHKD